MKTGLLTMLAVVAVGLAGNDLHAVLPYPVVDTAQAKCYNNRGEIAPPQPGQPFYGQDAQFTHHPPSYTLNADGLTVSDDVTGLIWSKADSGKGFGWQDALAWVQEKNAEKYLGHADWRLPNVKELQGLVDYTRAPDTTHSPAIDPVLDCTRITNEVGQADYPFYWSGTTHAGFMGGSAAMYVAFGRAGGWLSPRGPGVGPPDHPAASGPGASDYRFTDVHGAGAQRSDPKTGDSAQFPHGRGPQGDVIRIYNFVRLVR